MTSTSGPHAARFLAAAQALTEDAASSGRDSDAAALLHYLDYHDRDDARKDARARLLRAAAKLRALFLLPVPDAPGLVFFGGEADPACLGAEYAGLPVGSLAGSGFSPQRAFEACVGEGIEYLSQFIRADDIIESGTSIDRCQSLDGRSRDFVTAILAACDLAPDRPIGWMRVRRLADGPPMWFPADLCLRRPAMQRDFVAPLKLSTGCAAGTTLEDAALRGALELVERDAAALWWRGGRRGKAIAPDSEAGQAATALLEQLRQGHQARKSWLLDITTDLGIPAVAAVSANGDGYGFAFGLAARLASADAARAAILEMCQGELAHHVVAAKRLERGDAGLNENDQRRLRHGAIDTRDCPLLQPQGVASLAPSAAAADPTSELQRLLERMAAHGIAAVLVNLTRPDFAVPVVRVLAPGLQPEPCQIVGERLARVIRETGGGDVHVGGMSLL
jgi:ribosomal protein S12 methylthiotransferase accessory factor